MEEAKKYVLGIEGSANKVGIGTSNPTKASLTSKEISYPILERLSWHLQEQASYQGKQHSITQKK